MHSARVSIRIPDDEFPVNPTTIQNIEGEVDSFRIILDRREHWIKVNSLRTSVREKCQGFLKDLLGRPKAEARPSALEEWERRWDKLCKADLIEVSIPGKWSSRDLKEAKTTPWELRTPWEFLITAATEEWRSQSALIVRHLKDVDLNSSLKRSSTSRPKAKLLVVRSLPPPLGDDGDGYDDEGLKIEQNNIQESLGSKDRDPLINLTLEKIGAKVKDRKPQIIHLAGVDPTQYERNKRGRSLILAWQEPGMMLGDGNTAAPEPLAKALCGWKAKPELVSFNFCYSASVGAAAVKEGARAAICFGGQISDIIAEIFFCNFYLAYRLSKPKVNLLHAFRVAWEKLVQNQKAQVQGTGIILWSRESLLDHETRLLKRGDSARQRKKPWEYLEGKFDEEVEHAAKSENQKPLDCIVAPYTALNYSILHNNRSPFESFVIWKDKVWGRVEDISIEVELHVGTELTQYSATGSMDYIYWLVHDEVRLALTAALIRSVHESVYTTMFVKVEHKGKVLHKQTYRVNLLPIDQWQDDDQNRQWLPSFVLPRDPTIPRIIDAAQKYMALLADDYGAGFDGYQGQAEDVDDRVRGIWWTLTQDMPVGYISPPPTFVNLAQRLRLPSDILAGHRGTCVDLALLVASCLESVDLYPVIFLLEGHAFAGYYRTQACYEKVREWAIEKSKFSGEIWLLAGDFYEKLLELVRGGELVPLETVCLTQKKGFWEAVEEGGRNLRSKSAFQYVVDIKLARECNVTPLPL